MELKKLSEVEWEIPRTGKMLVPGKIFASEKLMEDIKKDDTLKQVENVAMLPGILKASIAMPDAHQGYGFPIGGVAAFDIEKGIISPGGVGYDINCSVRLLKTNLTLKDINSKKREVLHSLFRTVPSGVGRGSKLNLSKSELNEALKEGAQWAVNRGYGIKEDYEHTEDQGKLTPCNPDDVSQRAKSRGIGQLGSLGAGNHFLEIQVVEKIFNPEIADVFGLKENQITIMVHCGSRGLGHQVASDYIQEMEKKYPPPEQDRELVNAPINSELGKKYLSAMNCAANFAFANKQLITHWIREDLKHYFPKIKIDVVYDVCHNIAKFEEHIINDKKQKVLIMRKGATRSFGPNHKELPEKYKRTGQPVLIPGSMGTASYVLVGTKKAEEVSWASSCFTGDTKIITNKGIIKIKDVNKRFNQGEKFLVPSIKESTFEIEWKPVINTFKRNAETFEVAISQTNRSNLSKLRTTKDHNFLTLKNFYLIKDKISNIISDSKMIISIDALKSQIQNKINPNLAYLVGALVTDGHVCLNKKNGKIIFTQKKVAKKLGFILHVQNCFRECFNIELREYKTKVGGGIINGRQIYGSGTDFICCQKEPAINILRITNNLHEWVMNLDEESALHFLAGVIDGDGTWNPNRQILDIFSGDENVTAAILLACLKIGILPYISKQRGSCFVIQISEKEDLIFEHTKRVKGVFRKRKYGQKLFSAKQMFNGIDVKWPFYHKAIRNNLISYEQILKHLHKYPQFKREAKKLIDSSIRMLRVKKLKDLGIKEVYNIEVADNHNYTVLTDMFMPILVENCHGAGRVESRTKARKNLNPEQIKQELQSKNIILEAGSYKGITEEAPEVYKDIDEVVQVSHEAGIGDLVARLKPIAVMKG